MIVTRINLQRRTLNLLDLDMAEHDLLFVSPYLVGECGSLGHNADLSCTSAKPPLWSQDVKRFLDLANSWIVQSSR